MASKIIALSLATAFLAVGCVAFPEDGGYYGELKFSKERGKIIFFVELEELKNSD